MPSRLDRLIAYVSPQRAVRRMSARIRLEAATRMGASYGYVGGRTDRKSMQEWSPASGSANADYLGQADSLRGRSRDLVRNSPAAAGAINTPVTAVVGTGLRVQSQLDVEVLGITDEDAEAWQSRAERIYRIAAEQLDIERELGSAQRQALVFRSVLESGDVVVLRRFRDPGPGELLGTRVQIVESDRVCNPRGVRDTKLLTAGVEVDVDGRTVAYHISNNHPGDWWDGVPTKWARVPAWSPNGLRFARLLYDKLRPGQRRGIPFLAPVIEPLKQLSRLSENELQASVVQSLFAVLLEDTSSGGDEFATLPSAPEGTPDGEKPQTEGDVFLNAGAVIDIGRTKPHFAKPERPSNSFDPFFQAIMLQISMGLHIPFEVLLKRFQASYSAARAALLEAWRFFNGRRQWLATTYCQWEYELVISEAIARGLLQAPGFWDDPLLRAAWLGTRWVGDSPGQVDETKAVKAARDRIDALLSTRAEETAQLTGADWDQNLRQLQREQRQLEQAGISPAPASPSAPAPPDPPADQPEQGDLEKAEAAA